MRVLQLGIVPGFDSMVTFHALAHMGIEGLVVTSPQGPYISIGYFQDPEKVLDLGFCEKQGLPVVRREVGGGTVLLDSNQVFYQLVIRPDHPRLPQGIQKLYELFSSPPIGVYKHFGIDTRYRPINDLVTVAGKKISGQGGANIGECLVFVGSIIMDFDFETMTKALRVPDEKFRDKLYKTMADNMSTMKKELGYVPPRQEVEEVLIGQFEQVLGPLEPMEVDDELRRRVKELTGSMITPEWFRMVTHQQPQSVKIKHGTHLAYNDYKAPGGLISVVVEVQENQIAEVRISGDFTCCPKEQLPALADYLRDTELDSSNLERRIQEFLDARGVDMPGVTGEDLATAILGAVENRV